MVAVPLGPAPVDITGIRAGDLNEFQVTLTMAGQPLDVTEMTFTASARVTKTATEHLDAVVTVVDGPTGVILVRWPGEAVRTWMSSNITQNGVWDLQMDDGTADPVTVVAGSFAAELDVTR